MSQRVDALVLVVVVNFGRLVLIEQNQFALGVLGPIGRAYVHQVQVVHVWSLREGESFEEGVEDFLFYLADAVTIQHFDRDFRGHFIYVVELHPKRLKKRRGKKTLRGQTEQNKD